MQRKGTASEVILPFGKRNYSLKIFPKICSILREVNTFDRLYLVAQKSAVLSSVASGGGFSSSRQACHGPRLTNLVHSASNFLEPTVLPVASIKWAALISHAFRCFLSQPPYVVGTPKQRSRGSSPSALNQISIAFCIHAWSAAVGLPALKRSIALIDSAPSAVTAGGAQYSGGADGRIMVPIIHLP
jgi:hypothetical protein